MSTRLSASRERRTQVGSGERDHRNQSFIAGVLRVAHLPDHEVNLSRDVVSTIPRMIRSPRQPLRGVIPLKDRDVVTSERTADGTTIRLLVRGSGPASLLP
jgi:hypothetical protein